MKSMREVFEQVLADTKLDAADKLLGQALLLQVMPPRQLYERLCERCSPEHSVQAELEEMLRDAGHVPFSPACFDQKASGETPAVG